MKAFMMSGSPSVRGTRSIAMRDFPAGYMTAALEADEVLTAVRMPVWPAPHGAAFLEFARRHGDFAIVSVAAQIAVDDAGRVANASVTLGGVAMAPLRVPAAEQALAGQTPDDERVVAAAAACAAVDANGDIHAPPWYRQRLARALAGRAIRAALERARGGAHG